MVKSLIELWRTVARDLATINGISTTHDYNTVVRRVEKEGLSFLTISLPAYGKDFERSLDIGQVNSDAFLGFKRKGGLPAFLSGFLCRVFDPGSGQLLSDPCVDSILAIRQLCYLLKKVETPVLPKRERAALKSFKICEDELQESEAEWTSDDLAEFSRMSSVLFGDVLNLVNHEIEEHQIVPKHGPGATADRLHGNHKWRFPEWTDRLERIFPFVDYGIPNHRYHDQPVVHLARSDERPVRVVLVPKTQKAPRVIAIEPVCNQFMQQGIARSLVPKLESMIPSRYFVGFTDQEPNQLMACEGSLTGALATLDLSEASDRVSNTLVKELARPWPSLSEAFQATRSQTAVLPTGEKIPLSKFASMGSALCFPMEAMVFTTIVFLGIQDAENHRIRPQDLHRFKGRVRVYGDDIVVPTHCATAVARRLESFGLKVNTAKSFWTGKFRESCGGDYYDGQWITPLRLSKLPPKTVADVSEIVSWVEFSNSLHSAGYWGAAQYCSQLVEGITGKLPVVTEGTDAIALTSPFLKQIAGNVRMDRWTHTPFIKAYVSKLSTPIREIDGVAALHKTLSGDWSDPAYREHLVRSGRPSSARLQKRWVRIHS